MPQLAPRILKDAQDANVTFNVSTFNGKVAVFVAPGARFSDSQVLKEETRPSAKNNEGHKLVVSLILPHPVMDQEGCCVPKDTPPVSTLNLSTLASKHATAAQLDDFVAEIRSYVATQAFADLVKGGSNW